MITKRFGKLTEKWKSFNSFRVRILSFAGERFNVWRYEDRSGVTVEIAGQPPADIFNQCELHQHRPN